jgi:hypothetical protein
MANYNPHAPYILGQEWVPIRQADYTPDDNVTERGYTFQIEAAVVPVTGAYYIASVPANQLSQVCDFMAVYPAGHETLTGPVKKLYIPASAVAVTNPPPSIDITEGVAALHSPTDGKTIMFDVPGGSDELQINFDTASYSQQLLGKRIIDVSIRYVMVGDPVNGANLSMFVQQQDASFNTVTYAPSLVVAAGFITTNPVKQQYQFVTLTDLNPFWDVANVAANNQRTILPWRYQELNLFRSGAPVNSRLIVGIDSEVADTAVFLTFLDMQVTYCEETRTRYGGRRTENLSFTTLIDDDYSLGQNVVRLYDTSFVNTSTLAAGPYTVTLKHVNLSPYTTLSGEPVIRAVRPYYDLPPLDPLRINTTRVEGDTFTLDDEDRITQLTLHTTSSIVTGCHPYGISAGAPVYGTITATQEIEDDAVGGTRTYQQVRFYARRYGNTTVSLTLADVATGLNTVTITPAELDALPEIVDGWREVTLRFATPPSFTTAAGDVDWRWTAAGELAGNQWQVLLADGPGTSVTAPASLAAALATGKASYYAPQGDTVTLTWQSPPISGTAEDAVSDAVLIFSQDPPTVTGFGLEIAEQELTVAVRCDTPPACVATGLSYVSANWTLDAECDTFNRDAVTDGFGVATSGQPWTVSGGLPANYATDGEQGIITIPTGDTTVRAATLPEVIADFNLSVTVSVDKTATGATSVIDVLLRAQDLNNFYRISLGFTTTGTIDASLVRVVAGVGTSLQFVPGALTYLPDQEFHVYAEGRGSILRVKIWTGDVNSPPASWLLTSLSDSTYLSGIYGVRARLVGGSTTVNPAFRFDDFQAANPAIANIELQRFDERDGQWRTIMLSTTPCPNGFADYEARVGVLSQYRIRTLNVLDFAGPWVTGSATIPTPGVSGAGDGNSVLIFTSNAGPDSSLAYIMQWEGRPVETFSFPEANFVDLQRIFGRDYFTAFYPLERGGDQFTRTLLVNAAAVTPTRLANFNDLRDLAWAQLDYVCVRDELGNRWLANVRVPDGTIRRDRTLYLATIQIAQLTDTPSPIDPS